MTQQEDNGNANGKLTRSDHEHNMKLLQGISMDLRSHIYVAISLKLYTALIWSAKGYLRYFKFTHLSTQTKHKQIRIFIWRMLFWGYHGQYKISKN